jgi:hypothetical protein
VTLELQQARPRRRWRKRRKPEEPEDPIVGYDLAHYFFDRVLMTVRASSRVEAEQYISRLPGGPYTSGDINIRSVTQSEWERRYAKDGWKEFRGALQDQLRCSSQDESPRE